MQNQILSSKQSACICIAILFGPAMFFVCSGSSEAAPLLPTLPQAFVDTTYSPPSGNTIVVTAGGNLQTAINNALPGDTIVLQAGAAYMGPYTLRHNVGSGWIYIRSSAYASLPPPGTRVSIDDSANMPKIIGTAAGRAIHPGPASGGLRPRPALRIPRDLRPNESRRRYRLAPECVGDQVRALLPPTHRIFVDDNRPEWLWTV